MTENKKVKAPAIVTSGLQKAQEAFMNGLEESSKQMSIQLDEEQKTCGNNMITKMQELLVGEGKSFNEMDRNNIINILQTTTMLRLNASATPRECYVILRNKKVGDTWTKEFEFGVEGDGNDKILREYGVGITKVYPIWLVREKDEFTYPSFKGVEITPPTWTPKDYTSKIIRVVYPVLMEDDSIIYHISERESVVTNLQAHISNNLMKSKAGDKEQVLAKIGPMSLEEIINDPTLQNHISPAWKSPGSREAMIVRKMRNNCIKKIPKDFKNAFIASTYEKTYEDYDQYQEDERINKMEAIDAKIESNAQTEELKANVEVIDVEKEVEEVEQVKKDPF